MLRRSPSDDGEESARTTVAADAEDARDRGSAALEFIFVGVLLLVPLVYLIVALGAIQGQALGVEAGARHIARAVATAAGPDNAHTRADRVLASISGEYGIDPDRVRVSFSCAPAGASCPEAGAVLTVRVATQVPLPLAPPVLGLDRIAAIPVEGSAVQKISTTWIGP